MPAKAAHLGYTVRQYRAIGLLEVAGATGIGTGRGHRPLGRCPRHRADPAAPRRRRRPPVQHDKLVNVAVPLALVAVAAGYLLAPA
jgi:hypothetical protein